SPPPPASRRPFCTGRVTPVAEQPGRRATFMPKPLAHLTGQGAHAHTSLWDAQNQTNLFLEPQDTNGLSRLAYWFIGGLLAHANALAAVTNPLVNSDKRLMRGAPRSGATWAPAYITYRGNNRPQNLRIPAPLRV